MRFFNHAHCTSSSGTCAEQCHIFLFRRHMCRLCWCTQLFTAITQFGICLFRLGGLKGVTAHVRSSGVYFWGSIPLQACGNVCIVLAFATTSAANALVLFYLQPIWASASSCPRANPCKRSLRVLQSLEWAVRVALLAHVYVFVCDRVVCRGHFAAKRPLRSHIGCKHAVAQLFPLTRHDTQHTHTHTHTQ
jgi:hypothetical protein